MLTTLDRGHRFLELRLDMLDDPSAGVILLDRIGESNPQMMVLATCRRTEAQGEFAGTVEEQQRILEAAIEAGAKLVDVEIETAEQKPSIVTELGEGARVVLSYHDFQSCPPLGPVLERLRRHPADVYKIAVTAHKPSDNLELLRLLDPQDETPLVPLAMGEAGYATRILAPSRGAVFTFAAPDSGPGTAPGQLSATRMRDLYQAHKRSRSTKIYGVIASPVAHSLSPALHNRSFRRRRMNACYLPFLVGDKQLADFLGLAKFLDVEGFSVTIPHKETIVKLLDETDELAKRIGAVNTVYRKDGKLCGTNTDVVGVIKPLEKRIQIEGSRVLVAGAGGAARAAVFALVDKGAEVTVAARNAAKAKALAKAAGAKAVEWDKLAGQRYDALIQATPVGMHPNEGESLFPEEIPAELVFDMVYNPLETALLRNARQQGKQTIQGLEMFLEQAMAQFELWTGAKAPRTTMRDAVLEVLQGVETR
ncbi:MAG: shikimate dehydrogenase [Acidobacteria bacterium]|nr:shikimate dehydrogenase [Acidobacteriota bacterium]